MMRRGKWITGVALVPAMAAMALWAADDDQFAFMPDGGRSILTGLLSAMTPEAAQDTLMRDDAPEGWATWATSLDAGLDPASIETLASYAALNLPLGGKPVSGLGATELAEVLPPDGKDLAVAQCQFCHALFSGYLMHDRDKAGWLSTFKSPFHTEIPMSRVERETFAGYSAINMPLAFDDVPPELRF
ncbi:hypothetical protein [Sediminimonas qiaohouensis]|uniref:hypothetical protein n=1 Tax=Sediminimonas qiaohouensis TaxID=552061 RepID=UPI00047C10F9|nr:hypothetical protein [Sediminimonas qiaohouensis]